MFSGAVKLNEVFIEIKQLKLVSMIIFSAAEDSPISFLCVQVRENSLEGYTADDAVVED